MSNPDPYISVPAAARSETMPYSPRARLLGVEQMCERMGCSRAALYRHIKKGRAPKPHISLGNRKVWQESKVAEFFDRKAGSR